MLLLKKWPCRLAGILGARGSGDFSMNMIVGSGDKKDQFFFKPQFKLGENFKFFSGHAGQNRSPPSDSGPEGFQEKQSTSSCRPSFLRHVPAHVAEEFKDPEFCKRVAGLERMLRVKASFATTPGVFRERDLVADSQVSSGLVEDDSVFQNVSGAFEIDDSSDEVLIDFAAASTTLKMVLWPFATVLRFRSLLAVLWTALVLARRWFTPLLQRLQVMGIVPDCLR